MINGRSDPSRVVLRAGVIVVTTDCCHAQIALPRDQTDLVLTQQVVCPGCQRRRRLDILSDTQTGMRAVWSHAPAHQDRRRGARR